MLNKEDNFGVFFDETYKDTPTSTQYNQVHIPGANARGTNFVAKEDRVYIIQKNECLVLDAATGKQLAVLSLPASSDGRKAENWGYIGVYDDDLIAGEGFAQFTSKLNLPAEKKDSRSKWRFVDYDKSASDALVVMDRKTGDVRWRVEAKHGFIHNAVAAANGVLYCLDKLPPGVEQKQARRGKIRPETYRLLALDIRTGKPRWEKSENVFGTWLSVSEEHGILLQSTRPSSDTVQSENGPRMIAYRADSGDVLWDKPVNYGTPPILHGDRIIAGGRMFDLKTGDAIQRTDPITGLKSDWTYVSTKGCNYPVACQNLITFRSSSAAFYDLSGDGGTGHFGGFKSGCTSNLVAADGVLNAPDYTRTCSCSFQNQTSLALVHMPELEIWTHNDFGYEGQRVKQAGVNLGAPGDRRGANGRGTEFPSVGGVAMSARRRGDKVVPSSHVASAETANWWPLRESREPAASWSASIPARYTNSKRASLLRAVKTTASKMTREK
jgi:outer membrane protein assembly factor BamB